MANDRDRNWTLKSILIKFEIGILIFRWGIINNIFFFGLILFNADRWRKGSHWQLITLIRKVNLMKCFIR